ncbi:MAG TPA: PPOX class F420-dependent oxidoreductase [Acidimicrobiales bacterium]
MAISDEKYMLLTTFRKDGTPVSSPVWVVPLEGATFGFATSSASGKAKRLARTARVTVQASDMRGRVAKGSEVIDAQAEIVSGSQYETIKAKVKDKYGYMVTLSRTLGAIAATIRRKPMPYGDIGIVITPTR